MSIAITTGRADGYPNEKLPSTEFRTVGNIVVGRSYTLATGNVKHSTHYEALEGSHTPGAGLVPTDPALHQHRHGHRSIRGRGKYAPVTLRKEGVYEALCNEAYEAIVAAFPEAATGERRDGDISLAGWVEEV